MIEILRRADLFENALVHDGDVIGHHQCFRLIVGDVDKGRVELVLQKFQLDLHRFAQLQIERAERFIEQEYIWIEHHAASNGDALFLAAGQLVDFPLANVGQGNPLEYVLDLALYFRIAHARAPEAIGDVLVDVHHREQRQMLEHHLDVAPVGRHAEYRLALDLDIAGGRVLETRDHAHQGCLATARRTENGEERTARDLEGDAFDGAKSSKTLGKVEAFKIVGG